MHTLMHPALAAERGLDLLATAASARAIREAARADSAGPRRFAMSAAAIGGSPGAAAPRADSAGTRRFAPSPSAGAEDAPVAIRLARPADSRALARLAALDDHEDEAGRLAALAAAPWDGSVLVAEVEGEVAAALVVEDGTVVADPFRLTDGLVALLRLRAAQLGAAHRSHGLAGAAAMLRPRLH